MTSAPQPTKKAGSTNKKKALQDDSAPFHFTGRKFHLWLVASIVVFSFILYGNTYYNGFSLDDEFVMRGDTVVNQGLKGIPKLFKMRYGWDQKGSYGYRPVTKVSFAAEYALFKDSAAAGHLINILLYVILTLFLFYFLRKLLYDRVSDYFLFMVVALFIAHPLHTEVVSSLKNRDTLLYFLFGLYSSYAFIKCFETQKIALQIAWAASGGISLAIGSLCKPEYILFVAITTLLIVFFTQKNIRTVIKYCAVSLLVMLISLRITIRFVKHILPHSDYHRTMIFIEDPTKGTHWYQRFALGFSSLWFYSKKLLFPYNLSSYYGYDAFNPFPGWMDSQVIAGICVAIILCYFIYKNIGSKNLVLFSLLLFTGTMVVFINIFQVGPGIVAERFTFLPSVGFCLLTVIVLFRLYKQPMQTKLRGDKKGYLYITVSAITLIYAIRVIMRNPDWKSHFSIYYHDAQVVPRSAKLQSLLGASYIEQVQKNKGLTNQQKRDKYDSAETCYLASVNIYHGYTTSWNNLGMLQYSYYKNLDSAINDFNIALKQDSNYTEALFNLACAYHQKNEDTLAEHYFYRTIESKPTYYLAYQYLSRMYSSQKNYDKIIELNNKALNNGNISDMIYLNLGNAYINKQDTAKAVQYLEKALTYYNKNVNVCKFLYEYYLRKNDNEKANLYYSMWKQAKEYYK